MRMISSFTTLRFPANVWVDAITPYVLTGALKVSSES
jgi:hypothetical protein